MDGVVSPQTAIALGGLGGLGDAQLEGIWTRYEDADEKLKEIAAAPPEQATHLMQRIYEEPVEAGADRPAGRGDQGGRRRRRGLMTPQRVTELYEGAIEAGLDFLVIQGTVISAEHVSTKSSP